MPSAPEPPPSFPSADAYNRIGLANVSPLNIFQAMKCGTFSFERGWWIAKTKDRWKFLTFPPCEGWVWGVECVLGPRHSCVESERASRGSPLSLQLKGLAVIGTKALSSRFFFTPCLPFLQVAHYIHFNAGVLSVLTSQICSARNT